ncbi:hypothetical protein ACWS7L_08115 [Exiguobacterium artemiae]
MKSAEEEINEFKRILYDMHCRMFKGLGLNRLITCLSKWVKKDEF